MKNKFIEYVSVLETHNAGDRVFLKSILDAEKITYYIQGEYLAPYVFNALPMRLMVREDQVDLVKDILRDVQLTYSYGGKDGQEEAGEDD